MAEIGHLNIEGAKANPDEHFSSPLDIVEEIMLTRGEKLATLERWRASVLRQLDAANEGMRTYNSGARHSEILDDIETARQQLSSPQLVA